MLPFSGQGANQAIESAALVGLTFQDADATKVPEMMRKYEDMRRDRIRMIIRLSSVLFGQESNAAHSLIKREQDNTEGIYNAAPLHFNGMCCKANTNKLFQTYLGRSMNAFNSNGGRDFVSYLLYRCIDLSRRYNVYDEFQKAQQAPSLVNGHGD
jgi:hypothetical protein